MYECDFGPNRNKEENGDLSYYLWNAHVLAKSALLRNKKDYECPNGN